MATLKCICGKGDIEAHDAVCYGETDYAVKICGKNESLGGSQGFIYIGNDYCYIGKLLDSKDENGYTIFGTSANLYRLKNRLGNWEFSKVVK